MMNTGGGCLLCCFWCSDMFSGYKKAFFFPHMGDGKVGSSIESQSFRYHICCKIRVVGYQKMINSGVAACFAVVGVQVCLLNIKKLSSPSVLAIAKYNISSKIRVVGCPKMTNFGVTAYFVVIGVQICLSDTKGFVLSEHMSDGKVGEPMEKIFKT